MASEGQPPPEPSSETVDLGVFTATPFYIFSQEYLPEWVSVRLPSAVSVPTALCLVHAARSPSAAERFPILLPVQPQPCRQAALLLARPAWEPVGVLILLDCREVGSSLFALLVPPRITREALLTAAGFGGSEALAMYVRTMPWPIPGGYPFELGHGDLVQIVPAQAFAYFQSDLPALLRQPDGWDSDWVLPGDYEERAWIISDDRQLCHTVPPDRRQHFRNDLSQILSVPARCLALCPARAPLRDHSYRGRLIRHLYAATHLSASTRRDDREPICLLDLRPILLSFAWYFAPAGVLRPEPLIARFAPRAPEGYVLGFTRLDGPIVRLQAPIQVVDGDVVALHFFIPPPADISSSDDDDDAGPAGRDGFLQSGATASFDASGPTPPGAPPAQSASADFANGGRQRGLEVSMTFMGRPRTSSREYALGKRASPVFKTVSVGASPHLAYEVNHANNLVRSVVRFSAWAYSRVAMQAFSSSGASLGCHFCLPATVLLGLLAVYGTEAVTVAGGFCLVTTVFSLLRRGRYAAALLLLLGGGCLASPAYAGLPPQADLDASPCCTSAASVPCVLAAVSTVATLRCLPTPCRAEPKTATVLSFSFDTLCTLLQESAAREDTWAFNAATLLDTLIEYYGEQAPVQGIVREGQLAPQSLSLHEAIPITPHQRHCLALEAVLPHALPETEQVDWLDSDLTPVLCNKAVPLEHRTAFANLVDWHRVGCPPPEAIHIYTDGSAAVQADDLQPCSWAFVVFAICGGQQLLLGQAAATSFSPCEPYHLGEVVDDALTAELLAICWGLGWTAQHGVRFAIPIVFRYDSRCAGEGAFGASKLPNGQSSSAYLRLNQLVTALRHYTSCRVALSHEHVYGHSGCLGNELADALARTVRTRPQTWDQWVLPTWIPAFASHYLRDWAWAMLPGHVDFPRPYAFEAEVSLYQSLPEPAVPAPPHAVKELTLPAAEITFHLRCVTFNALTLKDPVKDRTAGQQAGLRILGRKEVLKNSLRPYDVHILGLQETRLATSEQQGDADYFIFNSAADTKGAGGCSLWLAKHQPYGRDTASAFYFHLDHVTVVSSSSRHLTANVLTPRLRLHIQVLHAPSACNVPVQDIRVFWQQRLREVLDRPAGADFLLLSDANAKVGSIPTESVGPHQADDETEAGALFHEFALRIQAFVPSTCATCHEGPGGT